ncbi:hypothetical protein [Nakamurella endophytica]|uniref:Uncharacterized protein n=1 Tax=Nakamurella endophytica TaxID=1748367 RepID=A0A917TCS7_9ACTN|nr:hypothetical protein [Nakamurella endophytica]GGM18665.1 hypothetical protein GCM10011594_43430 [Nakamurella endophytica]
MSRGQSPNLAILNVVDTAAPLRRPVAAARVGVAATILLVIWGVFAMHVLGAHDQDGGHAMPATAPADAMDMQAVQAVPAAPAPQHHTDHAVHHPADPPAQHVAAAGQPRHFTPAAAPAVDVDRTDAAAVRTGHGRPMDSMAGCVLFLVTVAGLILSLLLALATAGAGRRHAGPASAWAPWRRGPPGPPPPRLALCVLRV